MKIGLSEDEKTENTMRIVSKAPQGGWSKNLLKLRKVIEMKQKFIESLNIGAGA